MKKVKKCLVPECPNTDEQGVFVGNVCSPCYEYINGNGESLYDNSFARKMRHKLAEKHQQEIMEFWKTMLSYIGK